WLNRRHPTTMTVLHEPRCRDQSAELGASRPASAPGHPRPRKLHSEPSPTTTRRLPSARFLVLALSGLVSWSLSSFAVGVVQVRACRRKATRGVDTQGRRGRDTGSYV